MTAEAIAALKVQRDDDRLQFREFAADTGNRLGLVEKRLEATIKTADETRHDLRELVVRFDEERNESRTARKEHREDMSEVRDALRDLRAAVQERPQVGAVGQMTRAQASAAAFLSTVIVSAIVGVTAHYAPASVVPQITIQAPAGHQPANPIAPDPQPPEPTP